MVSEGGKMDELGGVEGAGVLEGRLLNLADVVVIQLKKIMSVVV